MPPQERIEVVPDPDLDMISEDVDVDRVRSLSALISETVKTAIEHRSTYRLEPFQASQADYEQRSGHDRFGRHVIDAFAIPWGLLVAAEDHLMSLRLAIQRSSVFSSRVLTRAVLEVAARAWWHFDPAIDIEERVRRSFNEQLSSAGELLRLESEMDHDLSANARLESLAQEAERVGFTIVRTRRDIPSHIGEPRPGTLTLMEGLMSHRVERMGRLLWRTLSAAAHGTTYAMLAAVEFDDHPFDPQRDSARTRVTTRDVNEAVAPSLVAYSDTFGRMAKLYGWDPSAWEKFWLGALDALFPPSAED